MREYTQETTEKKMNTLKEIYEEAKISQTMSQDLGTKSVSNETVEFAIKFNYFCANHRLIQPSMTYNYADRLGFVFKNRFGLVNIEVCYNESNAKYLIFCKTSYSNHKNYETEKDVHLKYEGSESEIISIPDDIRVHLIDIDLSSAVDIILSSIETIKSHLSEINEYYYEFDELIDKNLSDTITEIWQSIDDIQLYKIQLQNKFNKMKDD